MSKFSSLHQSIKSREESKSITMKALPSDDTQASMEVSAVTQFLQSFNVSTIRVIFRARLCSRLHSDPVKTLLVSQELSIQKDQDLEYEGFGKRRQASMNACLQFVKPQPLRFGDAMKYRSELRIMEAAVRRVCKEAMERQLP